MAVVTTREGAKHIKNNDKSESPRPGSEGRPRAHGPGEVSPDHGPTVDGPRARPRYGVKPYSEVRRYDRGVPRAPGDGDTRYIR